jgi:hypothetical protein
MVMNLCPATRMLCPFHPLSVAFYSFKYASRLGRRVVPVNGFDHVLSHSRLLYFTGSIFLYSGPDQPQWRDPKDFPSVEKEESFLGVVPFLCLVVKDTLSFSMIYGRTPPAPRVLFGLAPMQPECQE